MFVVVGIPSEGRMTRFKIPVEEQSRNFAARGEQRAAVARIFGSLRRFDRAEKGLLKDQIIASLVTEKIPLKDVQPVAGGCLELAFKPFDHGGGNVQNGDIPESFFQQIPGFIAVSGTWDQDSDFFVLQLVNVGF